MGTYLVTGAAGFIGAALAKRLVLDGNKVVTIDNLSTGIKVDVKHLYMRVQCLFMEMRMLVQ